MRSIRNKNIGVNAILNVLKQCLSLFFPLITYPYVVRVLGAEGIGKVSYGSSIVSYFSLLAMLGVANYAIREGSKRKYDKQEFEKFTRDVFTINILFSALAYVLLFFAVIYVEKLHDYSKLLVLQSLSIIFTVMAVDWINNVFEDFLLITVRTIFTNVFSLVLLFLFVKDVNDYYIYALLTVVTNGVICITNWVYCRKYVKLRLTSHPHIKNHIKPLLILFANSLAITIYINFNTTMLGWMKGDYEVGLFAVAVKIYSVFKYMMGAIYAVAMPRLAYYGGQNDFKSYKKLYTDLWGYVSLMLIPLAVGIICIAPELMVIMGGENYIGASLSLQILAGALICAIFGGLVTGCLNIALGREKETLKATVISAVLNFTLNLYFIKKFSINGAALTTLISELFVFIFCFIRIKDIDKYIDTKIVKNTIIHATIGTVIMLLYSLGIRYFVKAAIYKFLLIIPGCVCLYLITLIVLRNHYFLTGFTTCYSKIKKKTANRV